MSKIEWTKKTWNPMTGCTKISEGCPFNLTVHHITYIRLGRGI